MAEIIIVAGVSAFIAWMWPGKSEADAKQEMDKLTGRNQTLIALYSQIGSKMTQLGAISAKIPASVTIDDAWHKRYDWEQTLTAGGNPRPRPVCFECCPGMKHRDKPYKEVLIGRFDDWQAAISGGNWSTWAGDKCTPEQHAREVISHLDGRLRDAARMGYH